MRIAALTLAFAAVAAFLPLQSADARSHGRYITVKGHSYRTMVIGGRTMVIVPMSTFMSMSTNGG